MEGEHLGIHKPEGGNSVKWISTTNPPKKQPLTWYKVRVWDGGLLAFFCSFIFISIHGKLQAIVDAPTGDEPIGLDMLKMGKGQAWLNGEEIGRYWLVKSSPHAECVQQCNYRGKFMPNKCYTGCGEPTQRW